MFPSHDRRPDRVKNVCRGINLSVGDENTHAVGGALLFQQLWSEVGNNLSQHEKEFVVDSIYKVAKAVKEHEYPLIDRLFEKGELGGITKNNLKNFAMHRVDLCLEQLGLEPLYKDEITENFIESWFYKDINSVSFHDFFSGNGSEYNIDWREDNSGS